MRKAMHREDGKVGVERNQKRVDGLIYLSRRRHAAKRDGAVLKVYHMPLGFKNTPRIELVQLSGRELVVENSIESLGVDMLKER